MRKRKLKLLRQRYTNENKNFLPYNKTHLNCKFYQLDEYKKENKMLEDKYTNLQKELSVLKSLFMQSSATEASSDKITNEKNQLE